MLEWLWSTDWLVAYQLQNATMNPHHENRNTRPYTLIGFSIGILRAFPFRGLTSGRDQSDAIRKPMSVLACWLLYQMSDDWEILQTVTGSVGSTCKQLDASESCITFRATWTREIYSPAPCIQEDFASQFEDVYPRTSSSEESWTIRMWQLKKHV